jgi:Rod binding domain-containing protein
MTTLTPSLALVNDPGAVPRGTGSQAPDAKVRKAAQDFEAVLLSYWLDGMQKAFSGSFGSEDSASASLQGLGVSAVSSALASSGGVGIAEMILEALRSERQHEIDGEGDNSKVEAGLENR